MGEPAAPPGRPTLLRRLFYGSLLGLLVLGILALGGAAIFGAGRLLDFVTRLLGG